MHVQLITLSGIRFEDDVYEIIAPTASGEIAVFPGHEPLVTVAVPGVFSIRRKKGDPDEALELFALSGGVLEITQTSIRVLVDEASSSLDIVEAEVKAAMKRAEHMRDEAKELVDIEKAKQLIDRHAVQLKVADLQRRRKTRS